MGSIKTVLRTRTEAVDRARCCRLWGPKKKPPGKAALGIPLRHRICRPRSPTLLTMELTPPTTTPANGSLEIENCLHTLFAGRLHLRREHPNGLPGRALNLDNAAPAANGQLRTQHAEPRLRMFPRKQSPLSRHHPGVKSMTPVFQKAHQSPVEKNPLQLHRRLESGDDARKLPDTFDPRLGTQHMVCVESGQP